jgi:NhaB family Na+:H+ antiporter
MTNTLPQALIRNFLGNSPVWYKQAIIGFLILNPILFQVAGPVVTGWLLIFEFIFTLALALKCYPLQPGGLLAIEAIIIGLASPESVAHEVESNLEVILLLMFMVAGIYFMKSMLLWLFTKILLKVHSKVIVSGASFSSL